MNVAEVANLEWGPSLRSKNLWVFRSGLGYRNGIWVDSRSLAEPYECITELGGSFTEGRNRSQVVSNDRALLGQKSLANIVIFGLENLFNGLPQIVMKSRTHPCSLANRHERRRNNTITK